MTKKSIHCKVQTMQGSANEWLLTPEKDKSWIVDHSAAADDDDDDDNMLGVTMNDVTSHQSSHSPLL